MLFNPIRGLPFANKYNEETNVATLMADIFANELLFNHYRNRIWWKTYIFNKHWQKSIHFHNYHNQLRKIWKESTAKTTNYDIFGICCMFKSQNTDSGDSRHLKLAGTGTLSMLLLRASICKSCLIIVWLCWSVSSIKTLSILIACYQYPISPHQDDKWRSAYTGHVVLQSQCNRG